MDRKLGILWEITERTWRETVGERNYRMEEDVGCAGNGQTEYQILWRWDLNRKASVRGHRGRTDMTLPRS